MRKTLKRYRDRTPEERRAVTRAGLLIAAVIGKVAAGYFAGKSANRLAVGFGMLPRGEVGLIFAAIGKTLGVIDDFLFSAIVLMVIVTTLIAPPLLKAAMQRGDSTTGQT